MIKRGFTLIELMIVVAIIAILAAIAIPAYKDYTEARRLGMTTEQYHEAKKQAKWPRDRPRFSTPGQNEATVHCLDGYKFVVSPNGPATQMRDSMNNVIPCD